MIKGASAPFFFGRAQDALSHPPRDPFALLMARDSRESAKPESGDSLFEGFALMLFDS
jgi:hypothetical protein